MSRISGLRIDPDRDTQLVERCLAGEDEAWQEVVRRYERLVYSIGISYHLEKTDLADLFQEVFAALVRGLPRVREPRALCKWLAQTSERVARAQALRLKRERANRANDPHLLESLPASEPWAGTEDLERLEQETIVRVAIADLPERCRKLLQLLYYEDPVPSYAVVARRLRMPIGSIGPTRARCIGRLREALRERLFDGNGISPPAALTSTYVSGREGRGSGK